jgi:glycosyltransferase involved in cell wall biosynthesis
LRLVIAGVRATRAAKCEGVYCYHSDYERVLVPSYIVSLICRKPFVTVVHDDTRRKLDSLGVIGLLRYELRNGKHRRIPSSLAEFSFQLIRRVAVRRSAACICVSRYSLGYAQNVLKAKNASISGNGVGGEWFVDARPEKRFDAVFVGRMTRIKGIYTLINAWKRVVERLGFVQLLVIGPADSKDQNKVAALIDRLGLVQSVVIRGFLQDDEELRLLVSSSRVFVLPSQREGFGLAVAEAMASGVPCVLSDIPAFAENFGEAALMVPVEDSEALANAIISILQDPATAARLGENGRSLVRTMTWDVVAAREADIVRSLLQQASPTSAT